MAELPPLPPGFSLDQPANAGPRYGPPPKPEKPAGPPSGYRPTGEGLTYIPGGPADPYRPGGELDPNKPQKESGGTDAQRANDAYSSRAARALQVYEKSGLGPRSAVGQGIAALPGGTWALGAMPDSVGDSPERQTSEQAKRDFATIVLRSDSGANAPDSEVERLIRTYFPDPGEVDPAVLENFRQARIAALNGVRLKAGLPALSAEETKTILGDQVPDQTGGGQVQFNDEQPELKAPRLSAEQQGAYNLFLQNNPNANAEQLQAFMSSIGAGNLDNAQAIVDARKGGAGFVGAEDAIYNEDAYRQQLDQQLQQQGYQESVEQPFQRGVTAGLADEFYGLGRAGSALMQGENVPDAYIQNRDLHRRAVERSYEADPVSSFIAEGSGSLVIPGGSARSLSGLAKVGAAQGLVSGYGYGDGLAGSLGGAAIGAPVGAAVGASVGAGVRKLSDLARRPGAVAQEVLDNRGVIEAGQRQGIPIRQPDARPTVRGDFAGVEASQTGNPIVTRTLQADESAVQGRLSEVGGQGQPLDDYDLGQRVQAGGDKYLAKTRGQANALYSRAEQAAGNAQGEATGALAKLDEHIADLKATGERTNAGVIKYLEDLKSDLSGGASIAKLRNIRKNMRGQINERNLTSTDAERRVGEALGALSQDVENILPAQARGAFKNADQFYRQRMEFKDQVVRRFVGPKNDPIAPETAAARFKSFMKSKDYGRFSRMIDELEPGDRADIAATVAEHLGKGRNGQFSLAALASNTDPKNFSPKALEKVFGKDGAAAIEDLRVIAAAKRDTAGSLNSSRTGVVSQRMGLKDAMMGIMGGSVAGIPGAIGGMAIRNISEKVGNRRLANALLSPDFSKWLKNTPSNPAAAKPYIAQLSKVAARNAGAAADIKAIQSALTEAFAQSPGRAAAEGEQENERR